MKILVINGSPRGEKSVTLKITRAFLEGMGESAEIIDTMRVNVKPCLGCSRNHAGGGLRGDGKAQTGQDQKRREQCAGHRRAATRLA